MSDTLIGIPNATSVYIIDAGPGKGFVHWAYSDLRVGGLMAYTDFEAARAEAEVSGIQTEIIEIKVDALVAMGKEFDKPIMLQLKDGRRMLAE